MPKQRRVLKVLIKLIAMNTGEQQERVVTKLKWPRFLYSVCVSLFLTVIVKFVSQFLFRKPNV